MELSLGKINSKIREQIEGIVDALESRNSFKCKNQTFFSQIFVQSSICFYMFVILTHYCLVSFWFGFSLVYKMHSHCRYTWKYIAKILQRFKGRVYVNVYKCVFQASMFKTFAFTRSYAHLFVNFSLYVQNSVNVY